MIDIKKIVVPTDTSKTAMKALQYALEIGKLQNATIYMLHVVDDRFMGYMTLSDEPTEDYPSIQSKMKVHMEEELKEIIENNKGENVSFELKVVSGKPCDEIINYSEEVDADLIILGTHGLTGLQRMLIGSVAERVVRRASRPVLVVRPSDPGFIKKDK
jgi:universal stress protein A